MPRTLLLMRHAKSSWKQGDIPDHDRPLKRRGKRDARAVGRALQRLHLVPDLILTSTATRAHRTARRVAKELTPRPPIVEERRLYTGAPGDYLRAIQQLAPDVRTVLLVGHNPAISDLGTLIADHRVYLTTADVAEITLPVDQWPDYRVDRHAGHVVRVLHSKELRRPAKT